MAIDYAQSGTCPAGIWTLESRPLIADFLESTNGGPPAGLVTKHKLNIVERG